MSYPIGSTLVAHLPHFLEDSGKVTSVNRSVRNLGRYLVLITEAATVHAAGPVVASAVACRRRPARMACTGRILVQRAEVPPEIRWTCPVCGDNGLITGWEGTPFDYSDEIDLCDPDVLEVRLPDEAFQALRRESTIEIQPSRLLAAALRDGDLAVLRGPDEEVHQLAEQIAAERLVERSPRHRDLLDQAFYILDDAVGVQVGSSHAHTGVKIDVVAERLPRDLGRLMFVTDGDRSEVDPCAKLKRRIDGVLAASSVGHRHLPIFMQTLDDTADAIRRAARTNRTMALDVYAYFIGALPRVRDEVQDETEMQFFCTYLCCEAVGVAAYLQDSTEQAGDLITAMLRAYCGDERYWFDRVPDLIRALIVQPNGTAWLARCIGELLPARDSGHQRELERLAAELSTQAANINDRGSPER
jgi:hypothetical protein